MDNSLALSALMAPKPNPMQGGAGFTSALNQVAEQRRQQAAQQNAGNGGFVTKLLPTIGATAGMLIPGVGPIASMGLSALGSAAGKALENTAEHKDMTSGLLGSAASGAIGAGTGMAMGKVLGAVGKGVEETAAPRLFSKAFQLSPSASAKLDPLGTSQQLMDYGIKGTIPKMVQTADNVMNPVEGTIKKVVGNIPGDIKTSEWLPSVRNMIAQSPEIDINTEKKLMSSLFKLDRPGILPNTMNPDDALDMMRYLQKQGYSYLNRSTKLAPNLKYEQIGQAYLAGADELSMALEKAAAKFGITQHLSPEIAQQLAKISPKLASQYLNAGSIQDLRSMMAPFYRLKQMSSLTNAGAQSAFGANVGGMGSRLLGGATGFGMGGVPGAALGMAASPLVEGAETAFRAPLATIGGRAASVVGGGMRRFGPAAGALTGQTLSHLGDFRTPLGPLPATQSSMIQPPSYAQNPYAMQQNNPFVSFLNNIPSQSRQPLNLSALGVQ